MPGIPARNSAIRTAAQRGEARELRARDAGVGVDETVGDRQCTARVQQHDGAANAAVADQHVAAESQHRDWHAGRESADEVREIVLIGRRIEEVGCAADRQLVCRASGTLRASVPRRPMNARDSYHSMAATSWFGTEPMEPAPIVTTIAVTRDVAYRRGHIADRFDEHRLDPARDADSTRERTAVGRDDRCFAGRIDVGDHDDVGRRQHMDEILEQVAGAGIPMRLECKHDAPPGKLPRSGERGGHLHRVMSVVVDQRECRRRRAQRRRGAGNRRPTPLNSASARAIAASETPTSRPTAIAASAFCTLCTRRAQARPAARPLPARDERMRPPALGPRSPAVGRRPRART